MPSPTHLPSCAFLTTSPPPPSPRGRPQGDIPSTPELEDALRGYAKEGNHVKLRELLEAKVVNIEAKDSFVSNATKLIAIYIIRTVFKRRWFVARRSKRR